MREYFLRGRFGGKGSIEPPTGDRLRQEIVGPGRQLQADIGILMMKAREQAREPAGRRALKCTQLEQAYRVRTRDGGARLFG